MMSLGCRLEFPPKNGLSLGLLRSHQQLTTAERSDISDVAWIVPNGRCDQRILNYLGATNSPALPCNAATPRRPLRVTSRLSDPRESRLRPAITRVIPPHPTTTL
jgi:hypothetical protein